LEDISNRDAINGLKEALSRGAQAAVARLGRSRTAFSGTTASKIPLPPSLHRLEAVMRLDRHEPRTRRTGAAAMNRAAEAAVPEAKTLLVDAVKRMSVQDAKGVLTGGEDARTHKYFKPWRRSEPLTTRFRPIVKKSEEKVKLCRGEVRRDRRERREVRPGQGRRPHLGGLLTRKALDGLFVAQSPKKRKKIRKGSACKPRRSS